MRTPDTSEAFRASGRSLVTAPVRSATITLSENEIVALQDALRWEPSPILKAIYLKVLAAK